MKPIEPDKPRPLILFAIRIDETLLEVVRQLAAESRVSASNVIRNAIRHYVSVVAGTAKKRNREN